MASGVQHSNASEKLFYLSVACAIPLSLNGNALPATSFCVGTLLGWLMTPDLDIAGRTHEETRIYRVSRLLGFIYQLYWKPYSRLVPHRKWYGHLPAIGTLLRALYAFWWLPLVVEMDWTMTLWILVGWTAQDTLHIHMDNWKVW